MERVASCRAAVYGGGNRPRRTRRDGAHRGGLPGPSHARAVPERESGGCNGAARGGDPRARVESRRRVATGSSSPVHRIGARVSTVAIAVLGCLVVGAWPSLLLGRGFFWVFREPVANTAEDLVYFAVDLSETRVAVVIPARNESAVIGRAIGSLLAQNFAGRLHIR